MTVLPDLARQIGPGILCINVTATVVVEQVVFGPGGLINALIIIDFGTTGVPETKMFCL